MGLLWDAIDLLFALLGAAFGPLWGARGRPWTFFGSLGVTSPPLWALSAKSLKETILGGLKVDFPMELRSGIIGLELIRQFPVCRGFRGSGVINYRS
jgi:hypothetical protein